MVSRKVGIPQDELEAFCRRNRIRKLSLFGSALGEDFGEDSDLDVLVEFEPEARVSLLDIVRMEPSTELLAFRPVP